MVAATGPVADGLPGAFVHGPPAHEREGVRLGRGRGRERECRRHRGEMRPCGSSHAPASIEPSACGARALVDARSALPRRHWTESGRSDARSRAGRALRPYALRGCASSPSSATARSSSRPRPSRSRLRAVGDEVLVHTGQHYDDALSRVFFDELALPRPEHRLRARRRVEHRADGADAGRAGAAAGVARRRTSVLVYGDTNSTLAGALAAAQAGVPVAHVEAGMRSYDRAMPEELNRVLTDHASSLLLCSSEAAAETLRGRAGGRRGRGRGRRDGRRLRAAGAAGGRGDARAAGRRARASTCWPPRTGRATSTIRRGCARSWTC